MSEFFKPVREVENIFAVQVKIHRYRSDVPVNLFPGQRAVLMPGDVATVQMHSHDERYVHVAGNPTQLAILGGAGIELFVHSEFAFGSLWVRVSPPQETVPVKVNELCYVKITADCVFEREDGVPVIRRYVGYVGRYIPEKDRLPGYVEHEHTSYGFPIAREYRAVPPFLSAHNAEYAIQYFTGNKPKEEMVEQLRIIKAALSLPDKGLGCVDIRAVQLDAIREQEENGR